MNKQKIQRRLQVTQKQIGLLEQCIAEARLSKADFSPRIYNAMIGGYQSQKEELQAEITRYQTQLGIKS